MLPTVMPVLTDEPFTDKVRVFESEPYLVEVILMDLTLLLAFVTGTAVNEPAVLLVPSFNPDLPL